MDRRANLADEVRQLLRIRIASEKSLDLAPALDVVRLLRNFGPRPVPCIDGGRRVTTKSALTSIVQLSARAYATTVADLDGA